MGKKKVSKEILREKWAAAPLLPFPLRKFSGPPRLWWYCHLACKDNINVWKLIATNLLVTPTQRMSNSQRTVHWGPAHTRQSPWSKSEISKKKRFESFTRPGPIPKSEMSLENVAFFEFCQTKTNPPKSEISLENIAFWEFHLIEAKSGPTMRSTRTGHLPQKFLKNPESGNCKKTAHQGKRSFLDLPRSLHVPSIFLDVLDFSSILNSTRIGFQEGDH